MSEQQFANVISMGMNHEFNQLSQHKPGRGGSRPAKTLLLGLKSTQKTGRNRKLHTCIVLQRKGTMTLEAIHKLSGPPIPSQAQEARLLLPGFSTALSDCSMGRVTSLSQKGTTSSLGLERGTSNQRGLFSSLKI